MKLTPQQASKIKDANLGNLVKKLKSGKTLTASEAKMIDRASQEDEVDTQALCTVTKICDLFNIARKTIAEWRKNNRPGVPQKIGDKEDLNAWRKFFAKYPEAGHGKGKPRQDRESLLCKKLEVEIELKNIQLAEAEQRLIPREDVKASFVRIASALSAALRVAEAEIPQRCLGLPLAESRPIAKEILRGIQSKLADGESEFWQEHPNMT
jgi:hypothetical protein